ncbi:HSP20-like chaperone [Xylaria castorea]|nr:HSP20-like chaperone [Xylaria castorea]
MSQVTPEVLWAQRSSKTDAEKNFVYLTISVPDVPKENLKLDLKPTSLAFQGHSETLKRTYHLDINFYDEIDVDNSNIHHTARNVELKLRKKELKEEYWPRLLKDAAKVQFVKTDFDKWVDEDEQNEVADEDLSQFGGGMGGMGGGMGGMGGMGGDFGGIDFSKLGGMGGMGGMGGGGGGSDDEEDEEEEDDMPALEGEEDAKTDAKTDAKVDAVKADE